MEVCILVLTIGSRDAICTAVESPVGLRVSDVSERTTNACLAAQGEAVDG